VTTDSADTIGAIERLHFLFAPCGKRRYITDIRRKTNMRISRFLIILLVSFLSVPSVFSADALAPSEQETVLDGVVGENEYSYSVSFDRGRLDLFLNWNEDVLSVGLVGDTKGWVAVGFNSLRMDGAAIFFGFVDGNDENFRIDLGRGHQHSEVDDAAVLGYALTENDGVTVMEVELPAGDFIASGAAELQTILAYGNRDSDQAIHRFRASHSAALESR
jgi:hypothetical protein